MTEQITVTRFDPLRDAEPYEQTFSYRFTRGMSLLNVLDQIAAEQDPTLSYSACCKAGDCGLCGVMVNDRPALLCRCSAEPGMRLAPLQGFPVRKDLSIDRTGYEHRRDALRLYLERARAAAAEPEPVEPRSFDAFKVPSRCIECYCCVAACPVYQKDPVTFAGPCALTLLARHVWDPRDEMDRLLMAKDSGLHACIGCGRCSQVCPTGAAPFENIRAMQQLKK